MGKHKKGRQEDFGGRKSSTVPCLVCGSLINKKWASALNFQECPDCQRQRRMRAEIRHAMMSFRAAYPVMGFDPKAPVPGLQEKHVMIPPRDYRVV